jgi:hypothetical protein
MEGGIKEKAGAGQEQESSRQGQGETSSPRTRGSAAWTHQNSRIRRNPRNSCEECMLSLVGMLPLLHFCPGPRLFSFAPDTGSKRRGDVGEEDVGKSLPRDPPSKHSSRERPSSPPRRTGQAWTPAAHIPLVFGSFSARVCGYSRNRQRPVLCVLCH